MKQMHRILALVLCVSLLLGMCACGKTDKDDSTAASTPNTEPAAVQQVQYTKEANAAAKSETVYITIDNSGKPQSTTVTDWIHTDEEKVKVTDQSDLSGIRNVKTGEVPEINGSQIVWNMDTTDLYYSGTTDKEVPVSFDITYKLDGKEMSAAEIAGKSGHAEIIVKMRNTCSKTCIINGKPQKIYLPVVAIGGAILQENQFDSIKVTGGLSLGDGTKQITAVAGAPGLCESLGMTRAQMQKLIGIDLTDEFTISADTTCFALSDMYFAVVPFCSLNVEMILPETLADLVENFNEIKKIFSALEKIDISSIIDVVSGDAKQTQTLVQTINDAMALYTQNRALIKLGSKYLTEENTEALRALAEMLSDEDFTKGLTLLSGAHLEKLIGTLPEVTKSLQALTPILQNEAFTKALEILSSSVMVNFFKQLPALADSLSSVQALIGNQDFLTALNTLSDPSVIAVLQKMPALTENFEALQPMLGSMQTDLADPDVQKCLQNLPATVKGLQKLIATFEANKTMIDRLISFANDDNVQALIETLQASDLDTAELEKQLAEIIETADDMSGYAKEWIRFGQEYGVFTASADSMQTNVIFVYNAPAIEKEKVVVEEVKEETHWYQRIVDLFKKEKK